MLFIVMYLKYTRIFLVIQICSSSALRNITMKTERDKNDNINENEFHLASSSKPFRFLGFIYSISRCLMKRVSLNDMSAAAMVLCSSF